MMKSNKEKSKRKSWLAYARITPTKQIVFESRFSHFPFKSTRITLIKYLTKTDDFKEDETSSIFMNLQHLQGFPKKYFTPMNRIENKLRKSVRTSFKT